MPKRRKLPHAIPPWVRQGVRHFITINCQNRHTNTLCRDIVTKPLLESAIFYEKIGRWYLWLVLVMPDHLHLIASFNMAQGINETLKAWKGYQRKALDIEWQSDFFEHRIRNDQEFTEKMHYVRMNPVRKGLAATPDAWPYVLTRENLSNELTTGTGRAKPPAEPLPGSAFSGSAGTLLRSEYRAIQGKRLAPPRDRIDE